MNILEYDVNEYGKNGSHLQGYINTDYDTLVSILGKPSYTDADPYAKVNCEWALTVKVPDGDDDWDYVHATIYNWKDGHIPLGNYEWHVGGFHYSAVDVVDAIVSGNITPAYSEVA
jgi:hypothetical protein